MVISDPQLFDVQTCGISTLTIKRAILAIGGEAVARNHGASVLPHKKMDDVDVAKKWCGGLGSQ